MERTHSYYLSLGSNIEPEQNLKAAIQALRRFGTILEGSSTWESPAIGSDGPNFLNICIGFEAGMTAEELKAEVLDGIEKSLGRERTGDPNSPRTIDIDVIMVDGRAVDAPRWEHPYVLVPMAEILPESRHPITQERLIDAAEKAKASTWIHRRPDLPWDSGFPQPR